MKFIFINLKRFDVLKRFGGISPTENPKEWISEIINKSIELGLGNTDGVNIVYLLPEGLLLTAKDELEQYSAAERKNLDIGCQGVYREDVGQNGNFGAFTTLKPATAQKQLGSTWAIIGHSEERRSLLEIINIYENFSRRKCSNRSIGKAVNSIIGQEVSCAIRAKLNVFLCVGETLEERGKGNYQEQMTRIEKVLRSQLLDGLSKAIENIGQQKIVIGYEPIWAIGPGKVPPNGQYIEFVGRTIKNILKESYDLQLPVVYGGGLKEENALEISSLESIDGGLVALTRFTPPIGFEVDGLRGIVNKYMSFK